MAYNRTYYFNFESDAGITWRLEMYDQVATAAYRNKEGKLGINAGEMKYGSEGSKMFAPLKPSTFSFEFIVTDNTSATYIRQLKSLRKERDVYVALYRETVSGSNSPIFRPYFAGQVLMDLSDDPDIPVPYPITIKAVDGIASLKYYDYLPSTTTQVGSHLYEIGETYIPDPTNVGGQYASWQECTEIISNCLSYSGEFTTAMGNPLPNQIYTSARWFNAEMPSTNVDPLKYTRIKPNLFYKKVTQENNTIQYEPKSCYDVLKDICKAWGMRMYYFSGIYYFTQINNFREVETGTQGAPNNIRTFRYNMDGTDISNANFINRFWGKYELPLTNQITTGIYKNHKLAGGKYGLLPAFKRVTIDFLNVDNINSFTSFPLIPIGGTTAPTVAGTYWEFSSLGTYTFDGLTNALFFQRIYLDVNNNGVNAGILNINWVMVARPAGTGTNTANTSPAANGWTKYMYTDWSNPSAIQNKWSSGMWSLNTGNLPFTSTHSLGIGPQSIDITSGGTAMFPLFPYNSTGSNFTAGDWEIGYYVKSPTTAAALYWSGHGTGVTNPYTSPWQNNVNYTNTAVTSGINASEFAPIISGAVGSAMSTTNLEQTGDDTAFEVVEDIIMGDAGLISSGGAIQIYTGTIWKNSDISGVWGIDTLLGGNSFSQQLAQDIIKAQAKPIEKFTVSTTIDASESAYYNDGTANRPQWTCPFSKFTTLPNATQGMISKNFIMHTGSYNFLTDTWKWVLYEQFNSTILGTTTTTTTNTGGINSGVTGGGLNSIATSPPSIGQLVMPRTSNPVAGLELQSSLLMRQKVDPVTTIRVASLITRTVEGDPYRQTITSLSITQLTNRVFKTGDKIVLQTQTNELQEVPAEETNPYYNTNRISFVVSADQLANATSISVTSKTIYQDILVGDTITFDVENLISQYQNKTEGSIAGFEVDADGLSKGGIEITGWLNSDTMSGATVNNLPTALSVKNYVDNSHPAEDQTLQEVTDNGNTTTNQIIINTSAPGNAIQVKESDSSTIALQVRAYANRGDLYLFSDGVKKTEITSGPDSFIPKLAIGKQSQATETLEVVGTGKFSGQVTIQAASPVLKIDAPDSGYPEIYFTRLVGDDQNARIKLRANQLRFENAGDPDSTYLFQGRAAGSGSLSDFLKIEDTGIITTGGTFSNQVTIPLTPIATTDAASKGYVDGKAGLNETLQDVTDNGNTTTNNIILNGANVNNTILGELRFSTTSYPNAFASIIGKTNGAGIDQVDLIFNTAYGSSNEKMRILAQTGNVGIGTTAPNEKLEINGNIRLANSGILYLWQSHNANYLQYYRWEASTGNLMYINNGGSGGFGIKTGNTERMRITSAGNVGIGTTAPSRKLDVEGRIRFSSNSNQAVNGYGEIYTSYSYGKGQIFIAPESVSNPTSFHPNGGMTIGPANTSSPANGLIVSGNVGIGTTSPSVTLDVAGIIKSSSSILGTAIIVQKVTALNTNGIQFTNNGGSEKMRILDNGKVGIGTTTPTEKLQVAGNIKLNSNGNQLRDYNGNNIISNASNTLTIGSAAINTTYIRGNVGIGTTSPSHPLQVQGNARVRGQLMVGNSSPTNTPNATLHIKASGTDAKLRIEDLDNANKYFDFLVDEGNGLYIKEEGSTSLSIKEGGNVGIGTETPSKELEVVGDTLITGGLKVNAANIDFTGLGTEDPGVVGRLYSDRGILKISAG